MKISLSAKRSGAMTLVEVLVVMAVVLLLVALLLPATTGSPAHAYRIQCVNNLKQCGLATRVWQGDNMDRWPTAVPATNGGSMDFITGPNAFRHLQVMSNELSTPKVVFCPQETDRSRFLATNFGVFCNSNLSFFVGIDATETNATMFLYGDHNITNGMPLRNGILNLRTKRPAGWTAEIHNKVGNICVADGSVQQTSILGLQSAVASTGVASNRLQMPILGP
jgi:type II secretory pathway pseudopilin PulG